MVSLDLLYLINNIILVVIYLCLYFFLYQEKPVAAILALVFGLIGVACYFPSNPAFEMLTLSGRYALALPDQVNLFLAAGETLLAGYTGTTFNAYYFLSTLCLLLFASALFRSTRFAKRIGVWGLISGFFMIIPSSAGQLGMVFSLLSLIPWVVFIALLMVEFKKAANRSSI